jgi:nucleotidyltransferase/DNA polymerase involved in DNA repair
VDNPVFLPIDQKYYSEVSNKAMEIIKSVVDKCEVVGVDECYVELTEFINGDFDMAVEIAQMLKTKLYEKIHISCSIGISYNKLLAKIGSKYKKPSGLFLIEPKKSINLISDLDISLIPGIGPKNKKKLYEMGIKTFKDISVANTDMLKKEFGSACSNYLCNSYFIKKGLMLL